jgi:hypothetical protein
MVGRLGRRPEDTTLLSASRAQGMAASGVLFSITGMPMILFFGKYTDEELSQGQTPKAGNRL